MSTYGNQQPPNPGPGQYGGPQPPPGGTSYDSTTYGGAPAYGAPAGGPPYDALPPQQPPKPSGTNSFALAGLLCAFIAWPLGLVFSIIGLVQTRRTGQNGKGLAICGLVFSMIFVVILGAVVVVAFTSSDTVTRLADPGCTTGKAAILDNTSKISNQDTIKDGLQATINGLDTAVAKAKHDDVRDALKAFRDDYDQLLQAVNTGTPPDANLTNRLTTDGRRIDSLCSVGTK
jgi:hypothetical protein